MKARSNSSSPKPEDSGIQESEARSSELPESEPPTHDFSAVDEAFAPEQRRKDGLLSVVGAYWQIFEAITDCIFVHDLNTGRVLDVNQRTCQVFGYSKEEIIKGGVRLVSTGDGEFNQANADAWIRKAVTEGPQLFEWHSRKKSGEPFWTEVNLKVADIGGQKTLLAIVRDISERKKGEEAARALQAERHDRQQAIEASRLKSMFLANVSHELRTPLASILGFSELLLSTKLTKDQREFAGSIDESSRALLALVNDLLDLSKIEAGRTEVRDVEFQLPEVIKTVERMMSGRAQEKDLVLSVGMDSDVPNSVSGDPDRLKQILINLVSNSIKFTEVGLVSVRAQMERSPAEKSGEQVMLRFRVTDSGIGIAKNNMGKLFVPFAQIDESDTRKHGGTGLGLSICKKVVELMGGEIGCESREGFGSTFWFTLPFRICGKEGDEVRQTAVQTPPRADLSLPRDLKILVVEDNDMLRKLVMRFLQVMGIEGSAASSGRATLSLVRESTYDIILMDCQMPDLDGFEATKAIREIEQFTGNQSRIIAMTASAMVGDRERCLSSGMDGYISKPFSIEELRAELGRHVKSGKRK